MTRDEIQKVRAALVAADNAILSVHGYNEALAILDAALAAPEQEPVVYWDGDRSVIPADDVSYFPNWTDYYPTPLYRHPAPQSQPVARVTGYYAGRCAIEPLDGKSVSPTGMAVYSAPVAAQSAEPMYFGLTNDGTWLSITQEQYEKLKPEGRLKVYEAPPSRKWQGLTDEQILAHRETQGNGDPVAFARAIEAALKEKNT